MLDNSDSPIEDEAPIEFSGDFLALEFALRNSANSLPRPSGSLNAGDLRAILKARQRRRITAATVVCAVGLLTATWRLYPGNRTERHLESSRSSIVNSPAMHPATRRTVETGSSEVPASVVQSLKLQVSNVQASVGLATQIETPLNKTSTTHSALPEKSLHAKSLEDRSIAVSDGASESASSSLEGKSVPPGITTDEILEATVSVGPFRVFKQDLSRVSWNEPIPVLLEIKQADGQTGFAPSWVIPEHRQRASWSQFSPAERQAVREVLKLEAESVNSETPVI